MTELRTTGRKRRLRRGGPALIGVLATSCCMAVVVSPAAANGLSAARKQLAQYSGKPTSIGSFPALKTAPPRGKTVVYLGTSQVQNVEIGKTVEQVAKLAHWRYALVSYDPANPSTFISAFNVAIAKHADYVMEAGTPLPSSVITSARQHHIKIALASVYRAKVTGPVIDSSDGYAQDVLMGELTADEFIVDSHGAGQAVEEAVPQYPILTAFADGFQRQVKADCPKCRIAMADVSIPQLTAGQLGSLVVSAVKSHPGYNYLVFDDGPFADGITSALSTAGITNEQVLGQAGDVAGFSAVKSGTELAWAGYSVPFPAWEMMDAAFSTAEGVPVPKTDATQPTQLVTHTNAGSLTLYPNAGGWNYPTNGLSQFEKLWHLG